jgi:hypothetical protein
MQQVLLALIATIVPLATVLVSVRGLSHSTPSDDGRSTLTAAVPVAVDELELASG